MDRRQFLKNSATLSTAATLGRTAHALTKRTRPNVLYVFSDQHRAMSMPGERDSQVVAPVLDRFRKQNLEMRACISNYPLCVPHRGIFISGLYPNQSKVNNNESTLEPVVPGLGTTFHDAGYNTAYVGKWHLYHGESEWVPPGPYRFGFEYWRVWANTNKHYDGITFDETGKRIEMPGYQPTRMTEQAIEFLQSQKGADKPFFMVVSWNPPHPPFDPPADDRAPYDPATLIERPNVRFPKPEDKLTNPYPQLASPETLRKAEQGYYGGVTAIDKEFNRLLQELEKLGMADDTIVIYTSDHGEMMGSHGHMAKQMPHEESCHVPFYLRIPGATRGTKSDVLFSSVDIYPTLCGLASIKVPSHCSGQDFSGVMRGRAHGPDPEMVFLMNNQGPSTRQEVNVQTYRGIRTRTHTYAVQLDGQWCLYDNVADPYQMHSVLKEPAQQALIAKLQKALLAWGRQTNDTFPYEAAFRQYSAYPTA